MVSNDKKCDICRLKFTVFLHLRVKVPFLCDSFVIGMCYNGCVQVMYASIFIKDISKSLSSFRGLYIRTLRGHYEIYKVYQTQDIG